MARRRQALLKHAGSKPAAREPVEDCLLSRAQLELRRPRARQLTLESIETPGRRDVPPGAGQPRRAPGLI